MARRKDQGGRDQVVMPARLARFVVGQWLPAEDPAGVSSVEWYPYPGALDAWRSWWDARDEWLTANGYPWGSRERRVFLAGVRG